jgi:hypothetical protein
MTMLPIQNLLLGLKPISATKVNFLRSINIQDLTSEEYNQKVVYDLEPDDEKFLRQLNATKKILSDSKFELIIDRCEKEAARMVCTFFDHPHNSNREENFRLWLLSRKFYQSLKET